MQVMNFGWVLENELAGSQGPTSVEDLSFLYHQGVRAVIRMEELTISARSTTAVHLLDMFEPVPDFTPPEPDQILRMIGFIDEQTAADRPVGVSCYAGIGRTGTVLACYLSRRCGNYGRGLSRPRTRKRRFTHTRNGRPAKRLLLS